MVVQSAFLKPTSDLLTAEVKDSQILSRPWTSRVLRAMINCRSAVAWVDLTSSVITFLLIRPDWALMDHQNVICF